jgi:hypothetical protein
VRERMEEEKKARRRKKVRENGKNVKKENIWGHKGKWRSSGLSKLLFQ